MTKLIFKNIFVYSLKSEKYFFSDFSEHVNIVHGRNTSGKTTLVQSILYTMGINDSKENLNEILEENLIFRLDCIVHSQALEKEIIFIRSNDTLVIKQDDKHPIRFDGINANNSYEYERYKDFFGQLFGFDLKLQKQSELVKAPLEASFLPYYISQSIGWVYIRQSIGDYRFYRDFKYDYLDYYTGLSSGQEKITRYKLEKEKRDTEFELKQLINYENNSPELQIAKTISERFKNKSIDYLKQYSSLNEQLLTFESNHSKLCNKISMLRSRQKVLLQVIKNIKNQKPKIDKCPTCEQNLPGDLKDIYLYNQDINDAIKEKEKVGKSIKDLTSKLNSLEKKIIPLRETIQKEYGILSQFRNEEVSFDSWLDHHANLKLLENISFKQKHCENEINRLNGRIKELGTDTDIEELREKKEREFLKIFKEKSKLLNVKLPNDKRYRDLYSISSFPYQGVELHKIVMAYHFSFFELIQNNPRAHKFPFILDAIFKEDIDTFNRDSIFKFFSSESKNGNQVIFTVAEYKNSESKDSPQNLFNVSEINTNYFSGKAKQICIGNAISERSFLTHTDIHDTEYLDETIMLFESI